MHSVRRHELGVRSREGFSTEAAMHSVRRHELGACATRKIEAVTIDAFRAET